MKTKNFQTSSLINNISFSASFFVNDFGINLLGKFWRILVWPWIEVSIGNVAGSSFGIECWLIFVGDVIDGRSSFV